MSLWKKLAVIGVLLVATIGVTFAYFVPWCLINDTLTITRGVNSKYTKKYDVEYEYKCYINIV